MTSWTPTPGGSWYGDGGSKRIFILQGGVPAPELTGTPPAPGTGQMWTLRGVNFDVHLAPGGSSLAHVRRAAFPPFAEWDAVVDMRLPRPPTGSRFLPLLTWQDESVMFWAGADVRYTGAALPPDAIAHAGAHEEYEKAVFLEMKDELIARLTAPVAPPTTSAVSGPRRFLRLRRTESDSTGRGIPDWWMLQYGLDPFDSSFTGSSTPFVAGLSLNDAFTGGKNPRDLDPPAVGEAVRWIRMDFQSFATSAGEHVAGNNTAVSYSQSHANAGPFTKGHPEQDLAALLARSELSWGAQPAYTPSKFLPVPTAIMGYTHALYATFPLTVSGQVRDQSYLGFSQQAVVTLVAGGPRSARVTRKFLRVPRSTPPRTPGGEVGGPYQAAAGSARAWNYPVIPEGLSLTVPVGNPPDLTPPVSGALFTGRSSISEVENGTERTSETWIMSVDLMADTSGDGELGGQDGADEGVARYVVNYNFDEDRKIAELPGVPVEDAIKWKAGPASPPVTPRGEPLRVLTPGHEDWKIDPKEDRRELTRLLLASTPLLGPEVQVFLTMPKTGTGANRAHAPETRDETQAFHLYLGDPWLPAASGGTTVPLWGGVGKPENAGAAGAAGDSVTVDGNVVALGPEVDITKYVNPQAAGFVSRPLHAGYHPLVLEGILFKGMPLPGADRKGAYPSDDDEGGANADRIFDGGLEIVVEYRRGDKVLQSDSVKLSCAAPVPYEADNEPKKLLAFEGAKDETTAQGFGKYAIGGRYGHVYTVTTNKDDANDPGSLRYAIQSPVPRTIVFALPEGADSGTITLSGPLFIRDRECTIAGQTAFRSGSAGVTLRNNSLLVQTDDVVIRHLRVRPGPAAGGDADAFTVDGVSTRIIFDHCSASYSNDCLLDVATSGPELNVFHTRPDRRITVQNCLLAWPLDKNCHIENGKLENHGYVSLFRAGYGAGVTVWRNLYGHFLTRCPRPAGVRNGGSDPNGLRLDFVNNLVYGWGDKGNTFVGKDGIHAGYEDNHKDERVANALGHYNFVHNRYKWRLDPITAADPDEREKRWFRVNSANVRGHFAGNVHDIPGIPPSTPANPYSNWFLRYLNPATVSNFPAATRFDFGEFSVPHMNAAVAAEASVLRTAGAGAGTGSPRDELDESLAGAGGQYQMRGGSMVDRPEDAGGWPKLPAKTPPVDTDGDGIPDDREPTPPGRLNPWNQDPRNAAMDDDRDGYTNLEEYLTSLAQ